MLVWSPRKTVSKHLNLSKFIHVSFKTMLFLQNFIVTLHHNVKFIRIVQENIINSVCLSVEETYNFRFPCKDLNFATPKTMKSSLPSVL